MKGVLGKAVTLFNEKGPAICGNYQENNGLRTPTSLQAVWHLENEDLIYFDGRDIAITYDGIEQ